MLLQLTVFWSKMKMLRKSNSKVIVFYSFLTLSTSDNKL
jgi:hypothetical protein